MGFGMFFLVDGMVKDEFPLMRAESNHGEDKVFESRS
jgi:hypothetical protein